MSFEGPLEQRDSLIAAESMDGLVRVALRPDGRVASVHLDPRVKRSAVDDLADAFLAAISAAQDELGRRTGEDREARLRAEREAGELREARLAEIRAEYHRQMADYQALATEIRRRMEGAR